MYLCKQTGNTLACLSGIFLLEFTETISNWFKQNKRESIQLSEPPGSVSTNTVTHVSSYSSFVSHPTMAWLCLDTAYNDKNSPHKLTSNLVIFKAIYSTMMWGIFQIYSAQFLRMILVKSCMLLEKQKVVTWLATLNYMPTTTAGEIPTFRQHPY